MWLTSNFGLRRSLVELCVDVETMASSEHRVDSETQAWRKLPVEAETRASSEHRVDADDVMLNAGFD